jgi:hypothetical protein
VVNHKNKQTVNKNGRQGGIGKRKGKRLWIIVLLLNPPQGIEREPASETKQPQQQSPEDKQPQDNAEQGGESIEKPIPDTST